MGTPIVSSTPIPHPIMLIHTAGLNDDHLVQLRKYVSSLPCIAAKAGVRCVSICKCVVSIDCLLVQTRLSVRSGFYVW
jgi:hypothetical protein